MSKSSLRALRDLTGDKDGGAHHGNTEEALPVGVHSFFLTNRQRMQEIADLELLRLKYFAAELQDSDSDTGQDDGAMEVADANIDSTLLEATDSSILLKCDTAGSLRNALGCIDPLWGIHVVSGRIGSHISKMDLQAAAAEDASVWGFNVDIQESVREVAEEMQVPVAVFDVLDELVEDLYTARVEVVKQLTSSTVVDEEG
mgnify:CR=1 FL=1